MGVRTKFLAFLCCCGVLASVSIVRSGRSTIAASLPVVSVPKTPVDQIETDSGAVTVVLTASLSEASATPVTVSYATADGTAKQADNDYVPASGALTFEPGVTTQTISVSIQGDTKLEDYETFNVKLSGAVNAKLGNSTGHVTIVNDDLPRVTMGNVAAVTPGQPAVFKAHLLQRYYQPIDVSARTTDGSAVAPDDYTALDTTVTFPAGSKSVVPISIETVGASGPVGPKKFSLTVSGAGVVSSVTRSATIAGNTCTGATQPFRYEHVVVVVMENKTYGQVIGSSAAPFQTALAQACASATRYAAVSSPSRPNYIAMTAGDTYSCQGSDADPPGGCSPPSPSLFEQVLDAGGTVRSYAESMSGNCETTSHGDYAVKHNPWPYFSAETELCQQNDLPMPATLDTENLPTLLYLIPDLCNDTHNCPVATGDDWLRAHLTPILDSAAYQSGTAAVIVTYDEYTNLPNVLASRSVRPGTTVNATTSHYGLLRTIEDMLGLTPLGQAASATSLRTAMHL